ncbi:MAG TPA: ATP-binding protein, partial [Candidatus Polarisedimenticolia bacterium]|nr:ATP-binding protein [Candidatus Polarisedimenticolia bacterium]
MTAIERARFLLQTGELLERIDDPVKLLKTALAQVARFFGAASGAIVLRDPVSGALRAHRWGGDGAVWDDATLNAFIDLERPAIPATDILAPLVVGERAAGLVALRREGGFAPGAGRFLVRVGRKIAHEAGLREEWRVQRAVDQIKERTLRALRPQDLFYQILHGLRTLTRYDHSSALLIAEEDEGHLVLHAEQVAWTKGKSRRIGKRIRVPRELRAGLHRPGAEPFAWSAPPRSKKKGAAPGSTPTSTPSPLPQDAPAAEGAGTTASQAALAQLLRWGGRGREPAEESLLVATLHHDGSLLGVLKIAAQRRRAFGPPEARAVGAVLRHVASVIHLSRRALSMEERILEAEKKHAMADLARAISHDVKNAIGAILPLAQQAREEVQAGSSDPLVLAQDLQQIEQSAQICQRIFDGMLQLARSGVRPAEHAPLDKILQGPIGILGNRLKRSGVSLELRLAEGLPEVNASRGGLEQLFLNLFTNALDAMPAGGRLRVGARVVEGGRLEIKVADTGTGISPEQLKRIHEPFYTTKEEGFGLGLAISRSIVWENDG